MDKKTVYVQPCPWCARRHSSDEYDVGWYFVCCGHTRLVWVEEDGGLRLVPVPEDLAVG